MAERSARKARPKTFKESEHFRFRKERVKPRKRKNLPGVYYVERIISCRGTGQNKEYLIKWKNYDTSQCTWEHKDNIPEALVRTLYDSPQVQPERLQKFSMEFLNEVKQKLKARSLNPFLTSQCDHDAFRSIFKDKGYASNVRGAIMLEKEDFSRLNLPSSWYYFLDKSGEGREIDFPVRAKLQLKRSTKHFILNETGDLVLAPTYLSEFVTFYITKKPTSKEVLQ